MRSEMSDKETEGKVLDLRSVFGLVAHVTIPAESTGGEYVEMDVMAEPGAGTVTHFHPEMDESYHVLSGTLEIFHNRRWRSVGAGESFSVPRGEVHGFRNSTDQPTRFINRHTPALAFQNHLETVHRLVAEGKVRGLKDPRSLIYLALSADRYRPDRLVGPPQQVMNLLAWIGRRLGYTIS